MPRSAKQQADRVAAPIRLVSVHLLGMASQLLLVLGPQTPGAGALRHHRGSVVPAQWPHATGTSSAIVW